MLLDGAETERCQGNAVEGGGVEWDAAIEDLRGRLFHEHSYCGPESARRVVAFSSRSFLDASSR
ncbi:MAG TPA: hypothetical protein VF316_22305, partial [Polyangiaceae bacterium]